MNLIDGIIIVILLIFVGTNLALGLVHALGAIVGLVLGLLIARFYYLPLGELLAPALFEKEGIAKVAAFVFIFFLISKLFALFVHFLQKIVRWLPFGSLVDRVGGILIGLIEGVLVLSILIFFLFSFVRKDSVLEKEINESEFAKFHITVSHLTIPLLPKALREIKDKF